MKQYTDLLGKKVKDKVTEVSGVVTSVSFDLYGCVMAIIKQRADKDGKVPESFWHDVKRLEVTSHERVMPAPSYETMKPGAEAGPEIKPAQ